MTKELELHVLVNAYDKLDKATLKTTPLGSLKVSLLKSKLKEFHTHLESIRMELIKHHGQETEKGITVKPELVNLFMAEYNDVLLSKHSIEFSSFNIEDFIELSVVESDVLLQFFNV